ncbi:MAG: c-type cytochrome domain-containing protein [Pirellulales bacterium]
MPQHVTTNMIQTTVLAVILLSCSVATADPNAEDVAFFEKTIRPVLVERCYECHSATAEMKGELKGGLRLDTRAGLRRGGDSGPAVVPGDLEASLLLPAIKHEDLEMPPDAKLSAAEIAAFETWIRRGAADPRDGQSTLGSGRD